jgi:hypothetical protein
MPETKMQVPTEMRELPIMQFIGNQVPDQLKTPEAKKTISKIFFWGALAALAAFFVRSLPALLVMMDNLVDFRAKLLLFGLVGIVSIVLFLLSPKIINFLHRMGNVAIFKADKNQISKNPIENLQLLAIDVEKAVKEVDNKINEADGVRTDFITDSSNLDAAADKKFKSVTGLYNEAKKLETDADGLEAKGMNEKARDKRREAKEMFQTAMMRKQEAETVKDTAAMYAQYANQFGGAIEILKDNRLAAKMYLNATKTTINIIERKLTATTRMKNASEGIAAAFNIKDSWVFQVAMQSAQATISQNVATIRNNIQFLSQNRTLLNGTASANRAELDDFVKQMEAGQIKRLNVSELSDPGYELSPEQIVDKGFKIL